MDRHAEIKESYKQLGSSFASFYDGIITYSTPLGKLMNKMIWGFNHETTEQWINAALSCIPDGFAGRMLEVPVGTGVLTMPTYQKLSKANITCLDYSPDMMKNAERRAEAMGINNIQFVQGDVGKLPFEDESFDLVLSLNGFHAFPDKEAAYQETYRVLKKGGAFGGCFYISGEKKRTDWTTQHLFVPKKSFTPPFETKESLTKRLSTMYRKSAVQSINSIAAFRCEK